MIYTYTTQAGIRLAIGRIPRQSIDQFLADHPQPEPPTKTVMAWGDVEEHVPVWDDPEYRMEMQAYYLQIGREQFDLITPALTILPGREPDADLVEMQAAGIAGSSPADTLRYGVLVEDGDVTAVVAEVFYRSTVTQRGIDEAAAGYAATWMDKPVLASKLPELPAEYAQSYRDRVAARFCGYTWNGFCDLAGPEQSACVAFYLIEQRLGWLASKLK